jgi:hypothetical protein
MDQYALNFANVHHSGAFANLTLEEQVACIRQTMSLVYNDGYQPLEARKVDVSEVELVFNLSSPSYAGPWASSRYEHPEAWRHYVLGHGYRMLEKAVKEDLWWKYVGLPEWDMHGMGSIMHTLRWVLEQNWYDQYETAAPADYFPSYQDALKGREYKRTFVLGMFSMVSVLGMSMIREQLLGRDHPMLVIDVEGELSKYAAEACGMEFSRENALAVGSARPESCDLIITNLLTRMLEPTRNLYGLGPVKLREYLFGQCYQALMPGGRLALVESFLDRGDSASVVMRQAQSAGFVNCEVRRTLYISRRKDVFHYMRTGELREVEAINPDAMYTLVAEK